MTKKGLTEDYFKDIENSIGFARTLYILGQFSRARAHIDSIQTKASLLYLELEEIEEEKKSK